MRAGSLRSDRDMDDPPCPTRPVSKSRYEFHPSNRRVFVPFGHACKRNGRTRTQPTPRAVSPLARCGTGPPPKFDTCRAAALPEIRIFVPRQHAHSAVAAPRARAPHAPAARSRGRRRLEAGRTREPNPEHRARRNRSRNIRPETDSGSRIRTRIARSRPARGPAPGGRGRSLFRSPPARRTGRSITANVTSPVSRP